VEYGGVDCALSVEQIGTGKEVLVCHKLAMECKCFVSTHCNISVETSCEEEEEEIPFQTREISSRNSLYV
jgi:hypothetical protein